MGLRTCKQQASSTNVFALVEQVYAASVMFGYFLRRVDKRFQLAKSFGMLPESREDTVARLERLFLQVLGSAS
jgi:hypothetical protein